jgi:hypothetical protein
MRVNLKTGHILRSGLRFFLMFAGASKRLELFLVKCMKQGLGIKYAIYALSGLLSIGIC